jgi:hypothetical protein
MRSTHAQRTPRSNSGSSWNWILIIGIIIGGVLLSSLFRGNSSDTTTGAYLSVIPGSGSEVYIKPINGSAKLISEEEKLFSSDTSLSVSNGIAQIQSSFIDGYLDKSSEMSYKERLESGEKIDFNRWRLWIESKGDIILQMKNLEATIKAGDIVMAEQPNQIFSTLYVLKGNINIAAWGSNYTLTPGKKIMISKSDLANPGTTLDMLAGAIGDSLRQDSLFVLRNGASYLDAVPDTEYTTGTVIQNPLGSGTIIPSEKKYVEIRTPLDQSIITTNTVDIIWELFSSEVQKVTINDIDAIVSPVDKSFMLKWVAMSNDITNIVYKAYAKDSTLLERWVITLYPKNRQSGTEKLTPTTFPINDRDYRVVSPSENPYITTDTSVTVSGTVPRNTVQYIMVNNYRLKKFVANSTTWYYYANMDYDTMKDGINLYEINFYGEWDQLLSKQLFTIVKEQKKMVSGEVIQ